MNKTLKFRYTLQNILVFTLFPIVWFFFYSSAAFIFKDSAFLSRIQIALIFFFAITFFSLIATQIIKIKIRNSIETDELTGLSTIRKFKKEVRYVLENSKNGEYSMVSIDINKFRYLVTSLGTEISNNVLRTLAKSFEKNAPAESLICRNYEDNFSILLKSTFAPVIEDQVLSMVSIVSQMGRLLPLHYTLEFSVGVYIINDIDEEVSSIIDKANTARQFGKKSLNPRRISFFTDQMNIDTEQEKQILFDMNRAFESNEFIAYYQPKFRFSDVKVVGAEALVRWKHKDKGLLAPGYFVPLFEKNGFIQKIDKLIFESVCKFLDQWNKSGPDGTCPEPITISCNLSRFQLYNPDVAKEYSKIASKYQILPSKIEIELTENLMMDNKARLLRAMNEIKNAGFDISVDDFGSGFSSLSLLKDIPANVLKLDKEFLAKTSDKTDDKDGIIVHSVIDMAKKLNMTTVAEGVEEKEQAEALRKMGCDIAQGYLYAKPMPEEDFRLLLEKNYCS